MWGFCFVLYLSFLVFSWLPGSRVLLLCFDSSNPLLLQVFFLLCSFILLSLAIHQHIHNISSYCPTIFGCSLLLFFFFFILFVFAFQYGHHETHSFIPWLCWGQISLVHLLYSPLDTGPPYTFFLRESVTCNSFSCNLLLLYWCPDYIVIYCKGKGTFYNFLVSDYHPLVDLCFKVISPVV